MSQVVYYGLSLILAVIVFSLGLIFNKKNQKVFSVLCKVFSLTLATFFVLRYMWAEDMIYYAYNMQSLMFDSKVLTFFALILVWFTYASNLLLCLFGFFDVKRLNGFVKFISVPVTFLNVLFMGFTFRAVIGINALESFSIRGFWFATEIGLALGYAMLVLVTKTDWRNIFKKKQKEEIIVDDSQNILKKYQKDNFFGKIKAIFKKIFNFCKKHWFDFFAVIVVFLSVMPSYMFQGVFGYAEQIYEAKNFEISHRMILYIGFILPFIVHYTLKRKEYVEKKFYLMFICLGTLLTYSFTKKFDAFLDPTLWPLHLCNTAMYIMPLVLIFNMKRFFYFTYFINVIGAFFAMLMPNYDAKTNIFSQSLVNFYVNHYIAFFMPLLFVSLGMFKKPRFKQFVYSMLGFLGYFVLVLIVNAVFTGLFEAGLVSRSTDFFFINSDFIADKLGMWATKTRDIKSVITINGINLTFYPLYQVLFFLSYVALGFGIWFIYEYCYTVFDNLNDMVQRNKKVKLDELALMSTMNGRSLSEPMNPENDYKLILRDFTKRYSGSEVLAVDHANLEVNGGEVFGFLGPNGAGKSTIIKTVVGIQPLTSGEIEVCGYDASKQPLEAKKCIGFVPDHYALYEKLTGREYINYIADLYNVSLEDRNDRIEKYVKRFELEQAFDNQMKTYSHGMKQKIAIMAALVHDPKVWILDEPLTGLDPNSIYQVKECMKERAKEGNIVFFSSHIIDVVEKICNRIAIIKKGHIICTKTVKEIEESGTSLEDFYMNIINGPDYMKELEEAQQQQEQEKIKEEENK